MDMFDGQHKVFVCAHCGRVDTQNRSWKMACKLHSFETTADCVITKKSKVGHKVLFYDPDPKVVAEKRIELGIEEK